MAKQQFYQPSPPRRNSVYDDEQPGSIPTKTNTQSAAVSAGADKTLGKIDEVLGANAARGGTPGTEKSLSPSLLKGSETGIAHGAAEGFVKEALGPEASVALKLKEALWGNKDKRNRTLFGGGIAGTVISIFVLLFVAVLPQKISLMIEHLQNRFFATTQSALEAENEKLFDNYLREHVFPGLGPSCPTTKRDKSCVAPIQGTGPVKAMYEQWRQKNLEGKLAEKYGIEFQKVGVGALAVISVKISTHAVVKLDIDKDIFSQLSNTEARQVLTDALSKETRFKQVFLRFQLRGIMNKYGIRRCVLSFCTIANVRNKIADAITDKKRAAVIFIAQRVLAPHFAGLSIAIQCLINTDCNPQNVNANASDTENGAPLSDYEQQLSDEMDQFAAKFGEDSLKGILTSVNDILEKGFARYMIETITAGLAGKLTSDTAASEAAGEVAGKAVPIVGWVNLAAEVVSALKDLGPKLKKMTYVTNIIPMIGMWTTYRTVVDESKSGHVDNAELGSFSDSLGPSNKGPGAETSPLYANLFESNTSNGGTMSLLQTLLPQKAYADAMGSQKYLNFCDGSNPDDPNPANDTKTPVPSGKLICPEESLVAGNTTVSNMSDVIPGPIATIANVWNSTIGKIFKFFGDIFAKLPGIKQFSDFIGQIIAPLLQLIIKYLIPNPFHTNMSGARNFDVIAGGGDAVGNEAAHNELGGQKLTNVQAAEIVNKEMNQEKQQFDSQSFWARLFDKNSEYSLVGQVALAMPSSLQTSAEASFANLLTDPFTKLIHGFSSIFTTNHAFAATQPIDDPFGIDQYGYPDGTVPDNPEAYWDAHCQDGTQTQNWNSNAAGNLSPLTEVPTNNTTNPCLLIQATTNSAQQLF